VPIVFETFGGMGEEAKKIFEYLYAYAEQEMTMVNVKLLFEQMFDRVAAEIARSNAMIAARYRSIRNGITP